MYYIWYARYTDDNTMDHLCNAGRKPEDRYDLKKLQVPPAIMDIIEETDKLSARGRMTEAYYELAKSSEAYPESSLLTFKSGQICSKFPTKPEAAETRPPRT